MSVSSSSVALDFDDDEASSSSSSVSRTFSSSSATLDNASVNDDNDDEQNLALPWSCLPCIAVRKCVGSYSKWLERKGLIFGDTDLEWEYLGTANYPMSTRMVGVAMCAIAAAFYGFTWCVWCVCVCVRVFVCARVGVYLCVCACLQENEGARSYRSCVHRHALRLLTHSQPAVD